MTYPLTAADGRQQSRRSPGRRFFVLFLVLFGLTFPAPTAGQNIVQSGAISLQIRAGFDGAFRDQMWFPVTVRARNGGAPISGRLVVRPETSGGGVLGTFSTPITLPEGGDQTATFGIIARAQVTQIRVELIDDQGLVAASAPAAIRAIQPLDRLYVVVSASAAGTVDMTGARFGGYSAFQAAWLPVDLPESTALLDAVDTMLIHDADTGALNAAQRTALAAWVSNGGHLIAAGGANWQAAAAGLRDLLPFLPDASATGSAAALGAWLRSPSADALTGDSTLARGTPLENAVILAAVDADTPLIVRQSFGGGTVDYLTADPGSAPLRGWTGLRDLWLTLTTTRAPQPGWSMGLTDPDQAINAAQILPGLDALPDVLPLCGFLFGYIALIGPINYLILNRLNRREWAWITIPILIIAFTGIAFAVGANLRGSEATLNRLAVVRAWPDTPLAYADGVIGLLSPRREVYTFSVGGGAALRPLPRTLTGTSLLANAATTAAVEIVQDQGFQAVDFTIDASFIAPFALTGTTAVPGIVGSATFAYDESIPGQMTVRGSVRNDGDFALNDPAVLVRGAVERFDAPLEPGDLLTFELVLPGEGAPSPAVRAPSPPLSFTGTRSAQFNQVKTSVIDMLGPENFSTSFYGRAFIDQDVNTLELRRRQFFLTSFVDDAGTTGRGDSVYVTGWSDQPPFEIALEGAAWNAQHSTVYLVEVAAEVERPQTTVTIPRERFTWAVLEQSGIDATPTDIDFLAGEFAAFRFTPFPDAVLSDVESIAVRIGENATGSRTIPLDVWNFERQAWESFDVVGGERVLNDPAPYLGAQNAVHIRVTADAIASAFLRFGSLGIEQRGTF
ncbi:MAG: hypothetical protein SF162_13815 [bacterium]|nr:hypothetical protein [bacterium]